MLDLSLDKLNALSEKELKELLLATSGLATGKEGKFYLYRPNPVMEYFHTSKAKCRAVLGGNRSGKTHSMMVEVCGQFLGEFPSAIADGIPSFRLNPNRRLRVCMIDYPNSFMKVIWPYIEMFIPVNEICDVIKEQGRIKAVTNRSGGFIEFMQYEQDVKKFQGSSRHAIFYDEEPPESIRDENLMRLVDTDGEEVFSFTPVSEIDRPIVWLYDGLYLQASRTVEMIDNVITDTTNPLADPTVEIFFASIFDNRCLSQEACERILSKFPKEERLVREKGHFMFQSGLIYKSYNDKVHLIPEFNWQDSKDYSLFLALDPHPRTPHAVIFLLVDKHGRKIIRDELFVATNTVEELAQLIHIKCGNKLPELMICDPAAWTPDPINGGCLAYDLQEAFDKINFKCQIIQASKDKSRGIIRVREELYYDLTKTPPILPGLYATENCIRFRYEITHYVWDNWKKDTGNMKNAKQVPVDKDDHMMENIYRLILLNPEWQEYIAIFEEMDEKDYGYGRNAITGY